MPRRVYPGLEFASSLVVEGEASLSMNKKTVTCYRASRATVNASLTALTALRHLGFTPTVFRTRKAGVKGHKPMKAPHARDVTDIVSPVVA
jgi:hypothetical protein